MADTFDEKAHAERDFFVYVEHAYRAFLEGDDDRCQELDDEKKREVEERMKNIAERNKQLEEVSWAFERRWDAFICPYILPASLLPTLALNCTLFHHQEVLSVDR